VKTLTPSSPSPRSVPEFPEFPSSPQKRQEKDPTLAKNRPARVGHPETFFGIKARPPARSLTGIPAKGAGLGSG
jgi:hypothetical protein